MFGSPPPSLEDRSGGTDGRCRRGGGGGWDVTVVAVQPVVVVPVHPTQRGQLNLIDGPPRTAAVHRSADQLGVSTKYGRHCGSVRPTLS